MAFTPVGEAVGDNMKNASAPADGLEIDEIVELSEKVFVEIFGEELGSHAKPQFLKNRTLTVTCSSPAMAQEIRDNQPKIVSKINEKIGSKEVDRIRYLV